MFGNSKSITSNNFRASKTINSSSMRDLPHHWRKHETKGNFMKRCWIEGRKWKQIGIVNDRERMTKHFLLVWKRVYELYGFLWRILMMETSKYTFCMCQPSLGSKAHHLMVILNPFLPKARWTNWQFRQFPGRISMIWKEIEETFYQFLSQILFIENIHLLPLLRLSSLEFLKWKILKRNSELSHNFIWYFGWPALSTDQT